MSISLQVLYALQGPRVELHLNDRVTFVLYGEDGPRSAEDELFLLVNTGLTFLNRGGVGQDDVIERARLVLNLGDSSAPRALEYLWIHFETYVAGEDGFWHARDSISAHQLLVPGLDLVAKQVSFAGFGQKAIEDPDARTEALHWTDFREIVQAHPRLSLRVMGDSLMTGDDIGTVCFVTIDADELRRLAQRLWTTVVCEDGV